jgi:hypothetical protein
MRSKGFLEEGRQKTEDRRQKAEGRRQNEFGGDLF